MTFSHALARRLNELDPAADWSAWDQELIQKVSTEQGISSRLVQLVENRPHSWLEEMIEGFSTNPEEVNTSELHVYKRVAMTIRSLARAGHAVLVGQGGRWITANMAGGVHVRLVAPREYRINFMAEKLHMTYEQASQHVEELDHNRARFFRRYWPGKLLTPQNFALTLNTAEVPLHTLVECVVPLVLAKANATAAPELQTR